MDVTRSTHTESAPSPPARRVVLLGASNMTRGISTAVATARSELGSPLDFYVAAGYGRSYGARSRVLARGLPGITECGLWSALESSAAGETFALLTDVGNDIVYGFEPDRILAWVRECLDRLSTHGARITLGLLPMASLDRVGRVRFTIARTLLFPFHRGLGFSDAMDRVRRVDTGLRDLAREYGCATVEPPGHWYGPDPIHVRLGRRTEAWRTLLEPWDGDREAAPPGVEHALARWLVLKRCTPERWTLVGMDLRREQPCATLPDGSRVSMF